MCHFPFDRRWPLPQAVSLACVLEASAAKAGNVHPGAAFSDMHFAHFAASALAVQGVFAALESTTVESPAVEATTVGQLVLDAVRATRAAVERNTNLGTLLLFAPLAQSAAGPGAWRERLTGVLQGLTAEDCRLVYQAIGLAQPGGLGHRERDDVTAEAPACLVTAMAEVAEFDAVARQYTTAYGDVFERLLPWLEKELRRAGDPLQAICRLQLRWLAHEPDGLIVRKLGLPLAQAVQQRAQALLPAAGEHCGPLGQLTAYRQFDSYLRADGHRRNPGTTADLIAATLLVRLRIGPGPA